MRLEAQRRGAENVELLRLLKKKDRELYDKLLRALSLSKFQET